MLATGMRRKSVVAQGSADAFYFVGGDTDADTRAANQNPAVIFSCGDFFGNLDGNIGIIAGVCRLSAEIVKFVSLLF